MRRYNKIMFVCTDNTAQSLMAEMICKNMSTDEALEIVSRGLVVLFPEPINPKAEVVLINHGITIQERTTIELKQSDMDEGTLIFTMNREQKEKLTRDYDVVTNIYTLKGFIEEEGDIMDPYGGTLVDYEECYGELSRIIKKIVIKLKKTYGLQDAEALVE